MLCINIPKLGVVVLDLRILARDECLWCLFDDITLLGLVRGCSLSKKRCGSGRSCSREVKVSTPDDLFSEQRLTAGTAISKCQSHAKPRCQDIDSHLVKRHGRAKTCTSEKLAPKLPLPDDPGLLTVSHQDTAPSDSQQDEQPIRGRRDTSKPEARAMLTRQDHAHRGQ